jgi:hypothetical protein
MGRRESTTTDNTAQSGVNAVEAIFLSMNWLFRRQLESDVGIDAQVEVVADDGPTGQLLALQIKSGASYFRKQAKGFVYYGEQRHLDYWDRHSLPILLALHNPEDGITLWQRIERHLVTEGKNGRWSITIPEWQTLTARSADAILERVPRSDPENMRRHRMALDVKVIRQVNDAGCAYVTIDEWQNKSLNFRSTTISLEEHDADPIHESDFWIVGRNPSEVFDWLFPWLSFSYADVPEEDSSGEILSHVFEVKLNDLGKAFLMLEDYYANGAAPSEPAEWGEPTGVVWDEDKLEAYEYRKALEADWEAEAQLAMDESEATSESERRD